MCRKRRVGEFASEVRCGQWRHLTLLLPLPRAAGVLLCGPGNAARYDLDQSDDKREERVDLLLSLDVPTLACAALSAHQEDTRLRGPGLELLAELCQGRAGRASVYAACRQAGVEVPAGAVP